MRLALCSVVISVAALTWAPRAEACSCGGQGSSAMAFDSSDLVFLGTVGQVQSLPGHSGFGTTTFEITHVFRGGPARQLIIVGDGTSCDEPFKQGEAWLVYARSRDGRITTTKCTRTRLRADASQDLVYLEGLEQRRPQGIVYGDVFRRIVDVDGKPVLQALFEPLRVIATAAGRRLKITTDKFGPYQLVLAPGDYEVWVERAGRVVSEKQLVHVDRGTDRRLILAVEYKD
jgi:hypothetical protein